MVSGAHPLIPLDLVEATWLTEPPEGPLLTADLLRMHVKALAKHQQHAAEMRSQVDMDKRSRMLKYMEKYKRVIHDFTFKWGDLVLIRNLAIKNHLDRKMYERYLSPLVVISRSQGGSYVLAELDRTIMDWKVAQFRVIPYFVRKNVKLPDNIHKFIDVSLASLENLLDSKEPLGKDDAEDYSFEGVELRLTAEDEEDSTPDIDNDNTNKSNESEEEEHDINKGVDRSKTRHLRPRKEKQK